ncbi:MAG: hypothetical protein AAGK67_17185 [Pseudomonadota bacterium]
MIFRRIKAHVEKENWFAVGIDFFIVVIGVFIGIQVANWNEARSNKVGLSGSLERLDREAAHNIDLIEKVLANYEDAAADMRVGREALSICDLSSEGQATLERTLFNLTDDVQPNFVTVALDQLARRDQYQNLLSAQFQDAFGLYAARLKEEHEQLTSHYDNMWRHHVNFHHSVSATFSGDPDTVQDVYADWGFKLDKPFREVCTDASFRNRFINTIGFYESIGQRLSLLKVEVETFQTALAEELKSR